MEYPMWVWITFFSVVFIALFVDIGIVNRKAHAPSRKETISWSIVWVSLALSFGVFIYWVVSSGFVEADAVDKTIEYYTGYLIELSLSIDNLFVFLLIFGYFKVPKKYQHRALFWGIFMALVMRMVMIFAGAELVETFHGILYFFGAFLVYTGVKMFREEEEFNPEDSLIVSTTTRFIRITKRYEGEKFFTVENGKRTGTLLLLVLIVINVADLVFAVDSIPAIFGITTDRFIVYTSNIFAILGLRTFFFLLLGMAEKFHFLKYGLAFVLTFIGVKMLVPLLAEGIVLVLGKGSDSSVVHFIENYLAGAFKQPELYISLGVVVLAIATSIVLSLVYPAKETHSES
ncbi:MAG: TerC family protein [Pyrinomonadaceae bacterium]|nr:TerC family protein [Pyrinomonadaceae bacterium]